MADSFALGPVSDDLLRVAVAAYLSRYRGLSCTHAGSDLGVFLHWCVERGVDPLAVRRSDGELFVRWLEEVGRFKPSTVSRRLSALLLPHLRDRQHPRRVTGGVRASSPPSAESPTLGLSHLLFEAMIVAARMPTNLFDFALVAMLGLLKRPCR